MVDVRQAGAEDADEIARLRGVMLGALDGVTDERGWQEHSAETLRKQLGDPEGAMAVFVVDRPGEPGIVAACAVGSIDQRLSSPRNPSGLVGYVFSVATEEAYRRRGYSRACTEALLEWFRRRGVTVVDLHASKYGVALYTSLGFEPTADPALRLRMG
ncbi:GNAT family N-acetyltransferase [Nocardia terpenica]|uniref:GNAT family N-acetyltransferase n=1 Tax=Nocardia terpenica TaxID=455432 RepID=UPI002FE0897E